MFEQNVDAGAHARKRVPRLLVLEYLRLLLFRLLLLALPVRAVIRPVGYSRPPADNLELGAAQADVGSGLLDGQVEQCLRKTKRK